MKQHEDTEPEEYSTELDTTPKPSENMDKCGPILPSIDTTDSSRCPQKASDPAPSSPPRQTESSTSDSGELIKPFSKASIYFNRVRKVPSFHCLKCKRSFYTLILFEEHKRLHNEERGPILPQHPPALGPFYLPTYDDTQSNSKIRWISRHFERSRKGLSVEEDLSQLHPFSEEINSNIKVNSKSRFRDRFVCRFCPCHPTFNEESHFEAHNRRAHPLTNAEEKEDENEGDIPLQPCKFCLLVQDLIERMHIGVPKPPLLTRKENYWHPNPFCTIHSKSKSTSQSEDDPPPFSFQNSSTCEQVASDKNSQLQQEEVEVEVTEEQNKDPNQDEAATEINQEKFVQVSKYLFQRVEILKIANSVKPNQEFWQCGICNFKILITKGNGIKKPFKNLKKHVQQIHQERIPRVVTKRIGQRSRPFQTRTVQERVKVLPRRFLDFELKIPKKVTKGPVQKKPPQVKDQQQVIMVNKREKECDICGRPVSNSKRAELIFHKFSHMNDEERKAAVQKGEGGYLNGLLMSSFKSNFKAKRVSNSKRQKVASGHNTGQSKSNPSSYKRRLSRKILKAARRIEPHKETTPRKHRGQDEEEHAESNSKKECYNWRKDTKEIAAGLNRIITKVILASHRKNESAQEVVEGN